MSNLSPFQKLPLHIAEAVVRYYSSPHHRLRGYTDSETKTKTKEAWLVLHDVSYSWRVLALEYIYKEATLNLTASLDKSEFVSTVLPCNIKERRAEIVPYVKAVNIVIHDVIERPSEEQFQELYQVWPKDLVFLNARSLRFRISNNAKKTDLASITNNPTYFSWIAQRIRTSLHGLREICFVLGYDTRFSINPQALLSNDCDAALFLAALFVKAGLGSYVSSPVYISNEKLFEQCVPALTRITSDHPYDNEFSFAIIRKSAATLESLVVEDQDSGILKHMVYHIDGQSIVYPRLKELEILGNSDDGDKPSVGKSIAPFPALQNLRLYSSYVFADDTMFRGNSDRLEHLDMELDAETVDMLRKYKVFSKGKFPRLRSVHIQHDPSSHTRLSVEAFMEFVFGMLSAKTQILSVLAKDSYRHLVNAIPAFSFAENFRIFTLDGTVLSLLEMLNIARLLPNMTDFTCGFKGVDPELDAEQGRTIPDHLYSQYYPLNHRLKCWHMRLSSSVSSKDVAVAAIAFAVLCPSFTFVKVSINANDYNKELADALGSGKYDKHAEKIKRLFYDV